MLKSHILTLNSYKGNINNYVGEHYLILCLIEH